MSLRPAGALAAAALLILPAVADALPRAPHLQPDPASDEAGLWAKSDKAELGAKSSAEIDRDPALNVYVHDLVCKLASEYCAELRVYVMDRPYFNASMAPNGYMEVWSGLLLRAETEDQLAFVLGHEIGHFAENHSIEAWRAAKARSNAAMALAITVSFAGAAAGAAAGTASAVNAANAIASTVNDVIYLTTVAAFFSFSRENEVEADQLGFARAAATGYDPTAGAAMWRNLMGETAQSDFDKVRQRETRTSIFNSHPVTPERVKALETLAAARPATAPGDRARYRAIIRPHLSAWLRDELRRRDFGESLQLISRLASEGEDLGVLGFYKGEAYRMRRNPGDLLLARQAYADATTRADAPAEAWRQLAETSVQTDDHAGARTAYRTYLERAPDAQDRWLVEDSLKTLDKEGT